jgi:hypothetical protein
VIALLQCALEIQENMHALEMDTAVIRTHANVIQDGVVKDVISNNEVHLRKFNY